MWDVFCTHSMYGSRRVLHPEPDCAGVQNTSQTTICGSYLTKGSDVMICHHWPGTRLLAHLPLVLLLVVAVVPVVGAVVPSSSSLISLLISLFVRACECADVPSKSPLWQPAPAPVPAPPYFALQCQFFFFSPVVGTELH